MKLGRLNAGPNHLLRIEIGKEPNKAEEGFPDAHLFKVCLADDHFAYIIQF